MNSTYRERIEKLLDVFAEKAELPLAGSGEYILVKSDYDRLKGQTIKELSALIQEVAKSAKPEKLSIGASTLVGGTERGNIARAYNQSADQYEQNIKELLGGSDG